MNLDPDVLAVLAFWQVAAAWLVTTLAFGFLGYRLGRLPNVERERGLRDERDANAKATSRCFAKWSEAIEYWSRAADTAFDEATAAHKLRGELQDARDQIELLIAQNHRNRDPATGHFLPTPRGDKRRNGDVK